jgi:hypothetical protein
VVAAVCSRITLPPVDDKPHLGRWNGNADTNDVMLFKLHFGMSCNVRWYIGPSVYRQSNTPSASVVGCVMADH